MRSGLNFVGDIFQSSLMVLLLLGCAASFVYGVWMLLRPATALRFNQNVSKWVSTDGVTKALDDRHATDWFFYRYHRIYGLILLAGGFYSLYVLSGRQWRLGIVQIFSLYGSFWTDVARDSAGLLMIVVGVTAVVFGIIMLVRPSLLRGVEVWLNRWVATDKHLKPLDAVIDAPDRFVARHARLVAALIVIGSLYVLFMLLPLLPVLI